MRIFPEHHVALICLSRKELYRFNFKSGDAEGIVNLPVQINDVYYSVFMREDKIETHEREKANGAKSKTQDSTTKKTKTARSKVREEREVKKNTSWLENREQDTVNEMQELTDNAENSTDEARKSAKKIRKEILS